MSTTTAVAERPKAKPTLREMLEGESFKLAIAGALPKHLSPERFIRIAITAMTRTPKLKDCDQATFFQSLLTLSQCGIEPDGRRAYLIPFENRKRGVTECQLIISYMGLLELAMRSGEISNVHADKVCEKDDFRYDRGQILKHEIDFRSPRGKAYAYYAVCRFKDGTEKCEVMTKEDVDAIRARSRASGSGPWVTDYDEMAKKTVFRRLSKWLPLSAEFRDALDKDADTLADLDSKVEAAKPVFTIDPVTDALPDESQEEAPDREAPPAPAENRAPVEPPPFIADTPKKKLALAFADAGLKEKSAMTALRSVLPEITAKLVAELTEEQADEALNRINEVIEAEENLK